MVDIVNQQKSIGRLVSCIHRNARIYFQNELEVLDLGSGQIHFLMILYKKDGVNQETLAERLNIDKATCARAIKKLESQGYITRKINPEDKRAYIIYLTEKAKKLKPTIGKIRKNWTKNLLKGFTEKEEKQLFEYLERIANNAITQKNQE